MDRVCPLLGLQGDRRSAIDGVDAAHRCHADETPIPLPRQQQAGLCLVDAHRRCERYLGYLARHDGIVSGRAGLADGLVSTRMVLAPEPSWRGIAGTARRARSGSLATLGAGVAALGIGGVALAASLLDGGDRVGTLTGTPTESPVPTATASPSPSSSPRPTPTPTLAPSPTPAPTIPPTPTPVATPVPTTPPPPPQRTYTVQQGDTLAGIAQAFGTTVEAIQAANGIEDPDEIFPGQVLVIP